MDILSDRLLQNACLPPSFDLQKGKEEGGRRKKKRGKMKEEEEKEENRGRWKRSGRRKGHMRKNAPMHSVHGRLRDEYAGMTFAARIQDFH